MTNPPTIPPTDHSMNPSPVTVSGYAATNLVELLELCDEFLRTASPLVHAELRAFLAAQPGRPDAGWLIDMLGLDALYLQARLALGPAPSTPTHTLSGSRTGVES